MLSLASGWLCNFWLLARIATDIGKLQLREARGHPDANVEPVLSALAVRSHISFIERLVHVLFLANLGGKNEQTPAPTSLFTYPSLTPSTPLLPAPTPERR